jgi:hypothetical protein
MKIKSEEATVDVFDQKEYLEKLLQDPKRHIKIIGSYLKLKDEVYPTKKALQSAISRCARAGMILAEYTDEQIEATFEYFDTEKFYEKGNWTLETMTKKIPWIAKNINN